MKAWYFSNKERTLGHGDGRKIELGITHAVEEQIVLCENGLHASKRLIDALSYAHGPVVWRVELSGEIVKGDDKYAASERTYLSGGIDISDVLEKFGRLEALKVAHLWNAPDFAIEFLKTGKEELREKTRKAAYAAEAAAYAAAYAAEATYAAAEAALAARAAAIAASASTFKECLAEQNRRLTSMVNSAIRKAG